MGEPKVYYKTRDKVYDIDSLTIEEHVAFKRMMQEYGSGQAPPWNVFHQKWEPLIAALARMRHGTRWQDQPIYKIKLDLVRNIGIQQGELEGKLSAMVVEQ